MTRKKLAGEPPEPVFPEIPAGPMEEESVVDRILSGHSGLDCVYEAMLASLEGDARLLVRLLREDWRVLSRDVRSAGEKGRGKQGGGPPAPCPSADDAETYARPFAGAGPPAVLRAVDRAVRRCGVASRLVPLRLASSSVAEVFRSAIAAEDRHLSSVIWLADRVRALG